MDGEKKGDGWTTERKYCTCNQPLSALPVDFNMCATGKKPKIFFVFWPRAKNTGVPRPPETLGLLSHKSQPSPFPDFFPFSRVVSSSHLIKSSFSYISPVHCLLRGRAPHSCKVVYGEDAFMQFSFNELHPFRQVLPA